MADDVNKPKGGKPVNSIESVGRTGGPSKIADITSKAAEAVQRPAAEIAELESRIEQYENDIQYLTQTLSDVVSGNQQAIQSIPGYDPSVSRNVQQATTNQYISGLGSEIEKFEVNKASKEKQLGLKVGEYERRVTERSASAVGKYTSEEAIESRARKGAAHSQVLDKAVNMAMTDDYRSIERRREMQIGSAAIVGKQIREERERGASPERIQELEGEMAGLTDQASVSERAMKQHKLSGTDSGSLFQHVSKTANRAMEKQSGADLARIAQEGGGKDISEVQSEMGKLANEFKALSEGLKAGTKSVDAFTKEGTKAAKRYQELEQEEKAIKSARIDKISGAMQGYGAASSAAKQILSAGQNLTVNQPIARMTNAARLAEETNKEYDMLKGAASGDMKAAIQLQGLAGAAEFQDTISNRQQTLKVAEAGIETADTVVGTTLGLKAMKTVGRGIKGLFSSEGGVASSALAGAVGSANRAATAGGDVANRIAATDRGLAARSSYMQAYSAVTGVKQRQLQAFRDYHASTADATRGMGAERQGTLVEMGSEQFTDFRKRERISVEKSNAFINQVSEMGGSDVFGEGGIQGAMGQARQMERLGRGTMGQQAQRMGQLANAGAQDSAAALKQVMQEAVSAGFDDSKSMSLMVDATVSMAQAGNLTNLGIDAGGGMSGLLAQVMGKNDPNLSSAAQVGAATTAISGARDMLNNNAVTFSNILRDTEMSEFTSDPKERASWQTLTPEQMDILEGDDEAAKARVIQAKGLKSARGPNGAAAIKGNLKSQRNFLQRGGAEGLGLLDSPDVGEAHDRAMAKLKAKGISADDPNRITKAGLTSEEEDALMSVAATTTVTSRGAISGDKFTDVISSTGDGKGLADPNKKKDFKDRKLSEEEKAAEAVREAKAAADAAELKKSKGEFGGVKDLAEFTKNIQKTWETALEKFPDAAAQAVADQSNKGTTEIYKNLTKSSDDLAGKFNKLGEGIEKIIKKTGIGNMEVPKDPKPRDKKKAGGWGSGGWETYF